MRKLFTLLLITSLAFSAGVANASTVNSEVDVGVSKMVKQELTASAIAVEVSAVTSALPVYIAPSPLALQVLLPEGATPYKVVPSRKGYRSRYLFPPAREPTG